MKPMTAGLFSWRSGRVSLNLIAAQPKGGAGRVVAGRALVAAARLAMSVLFFILVLRHVQVGDLAVQYSRARMWPLLAGLALLAIQFPIAGWRWHMVLRVGGAEVSPWLLQNLVWVGQFINQVTPTVLIGDALRSWYLTRANVSTRQALSSVVLDRAVGLVGLLTLILLLSPLMLWQLGGGAGWPIIGTAAAGLAAGALGFIGCKLLLQTRCLSRWPRVEAIAKDAWESAAKVSRSPLIVMSAVVTNAIASIAAYLVAMSLGIGLSIVTALTLIPVALFAVLVPISVAGWGVREGVLVFLLGLVGIPGSQGLSLSIGYGIITVIAALPGGLIWLMWRGQAERGI
jgi:glycosyltransferase 2 family protein